VTRFLEATRERFLVAIAASLPPERFIELHFFSPIRQGGAESGVAVVAAHPERVEQIVLADAAPDCDSEERSDEDSACESSEEPADPSSPSLLGMTHPHPAPRVPHPGRYTVYSAKYKLVLKGPDRGKWECSVVAEADAPLVTVETVVRGVQRRSGDAEAPERMSGDDARDYLLAAAR
jgi:hypothetical protein